MNSSKFHRPLYSPSSYEYVNGDEKVRTLIAERHLFKRVKNYFTNSLLYQDSPKTDENPQPEELDSSNESDVELETEEECLWELKPLLTSINKLNVNNTANDIGEWYINEELNLAYFSVFASNFKPLGTSSPWLAIYDLTGDDAQCESWIYLNAAHLR